MSPSKRASDQELDGLFTLDPAQFIAARDALAKRLKDEGKSEDAATVKALRRPTVAAWVVNQVVRAERSDVDELLAAAADLRAVQRKVLSGVKAEGFREAMDRRRRIVGRLTKAAERVLADAGHGSTGVSEAVAATFEAASLDEDAAEQVTVGRLSKELPAPSGFGGVGGLELVPAVVEQPPAKRSGGPTEAEARRAAERESKQLMDQAARARRDAIKARDQAERARARAEDLERQAAEAKVRAREIEREARTAEAEATRAEAAAARVKRP